MLADELMKVVNEALKVYHRTHIERYPKARAIDRLEELTKPNSREREMAMNVLVYCIDKLEKETEY